MNRDWWREDGFHRYEHAESQRGPAKSLRMQKQSNHVRVSVIVPTIGRAASLRRMLDSLCLQSFKVYEVVVADGSDTDETATVVADECWLRAHLRVKRIAIQPPNAVRQRKAAVAEAGGEYLLFLDDDVVLDSDCIEQMINLLRQDEGIVGVFADLKNQS